MSVCSCTTDSVVSINIWSVSMVAPSIFNLNLASCSEFTGFVCSAATAFDFWRRVILHFSRNRLGHLFYLSLVKPTSSCARGANKLKSPGSLPGRSTVIYSFDLANKLLPLMVPNKLEHFSSIIMNGVCRCPQTRRRSRTKGTDPIGIRSKTNINYCRHGTGTCN